MTKRLLLICGILGLILLLAGQGWAVYSDSFTGADGTDLHTHNAAWTSSIGSGVWKIQSNTAAPQTAAADQYAVYTGGTFSGSQYSQAKLAAGTYMGVGVNFNSTATAGYMAFMAGSNTSIIIKKLPSTTLGLQFTVSAVSYGTSKMKLSSDGKSPTTTITLYIDYAGNGTWTKIGTRTDSSSPVTNGYPGIYGYGTDPRVDDWEGGDNISGTSSMGLGMGLIGSNWLQRRNP